MNRRFVRFRGRGAPIFAAALGAWILGGAAARAQTIPACVNGSQQAPCTSGNIEFSNPSGVAASGIWRAGSEATGDPFNPGFSTGNIAESTINGSVTKSGSFTVSTLSGLAAIAGVSVSSTCGVTGGGSASLSVSLNNGPPVVLPCPSPYSGPGAPQTQTVTQNLTFAPVSSVTVDLTVSGAISGSGSVIWTDISGQLSLNPVYYFPHLAFGGGWETTLTLLNYSPQAVSCTTAFLNDSGQPLTVPFADQNGAMRTDNLQPGGSIHVQTQASDVSGSGWAYAQCTGPIKASLLYRYYSNGTAQGEAGVNAMTAPAREFVTFGQYQTGIAWANPTTMAATVTISALDGATGAVQGSTTFNLPPNAHGANTVSNLFTLPSTFSGSIQITATVPIISLSLNAEAYPVFSSLPPGDLPDGTALAGTR
jgi:hypothetical protein